MLEHIHTVLISLTTAAIVFAATYFFDDKSEKAVLTAQLNTISAQVAELRSDVRGIQSNFATKDGHLDHENRIRSLERRVQK